MRAAIRRARSRDAQAVAAIVKEAFGERLAEARLAENLAAGINFVALVDERVVGFAGGFLTTSHDGKLRFELDLLAVAAEARGAGIGSELVSQSLVEARARNVDLIRALVAARNRGMQRLCRAAGFRLSAPANGLYVLDMGNPLSLEAESQPCLSQPSSEDMGLDAKAWGAHLVPVDTLAYGGIWLEGQISSRAIRLAYTRARIEERSRIGALIPPGQADAIDLLTTCGFQRIGEYEWWTIRPGSA